jgi:hypothetical protein
MTKSGLAPGVATVKALGREDRRQNMPIAGDLQDVAAAGAQTAEDIREFLIAGRLGAASRLWARQAKLRRDWEGCRKAQLTQTRRRSDCELQ